MKLAIASGKGGTGKTTVAANLAYVAPDSEDDVMFMDLDVEEPNAAIFLKPEIRGKTRIDVSVPVIDETKCTGCGLCADICRYNSLVMLDGKPSVFPELCHSCGGCWLVCPVGAITEGNREIGYMEFGQVANVEFVQGILNIGEPSSTALIRQILERVAEKRLTIIDCPPGTSCPVIESVHSADYIILVTEPTPFGLNDLHLAVEMVRVLGIPFGVVINRSDIGDNRVNMYCQTQQIDILLEIPDDRRVAEAYSRGELASQAELKYRELFVELLDKVGGQR